MSIDHLHRAQVALAKDHVCYSAVIKLQDLQLKLREVLIKTI